MTNQMSNDRAVAAVIKSIGMCVSMTLGLFVGYQVFKRLDPNSEAKELAKKKVIC